MSVVHECGPDTIFFILLAAKAAEGAIDVVLLDLLVSATILIGLVEIFPSGKCLLLEVDRKLVFVEVGFGV